MAEKEKNVHKGHRQKVKDRYIQTGFEGMADHNILELLLFFGIPYKDTNPIAHELMDTFGSLSAVFQASVAELKSVKGMTENAACLLNMMLPLYARYSADLAADKPMLMSTEEVVEFMRPRFLDTNNERAFALCFDMEHRLVAARKLSEGDVNSTALDMRKLASAVLETKAVAVILVHSHPNGIPLPSKNDVEVTEKACGFLKTMKVDLLDHVIVAKTGHCSMISLSKFTHIFYGMNQLF